MKLLIIYLYNSKVLSFNTNLDNIYTIILHKNGYVFLIEGNSYLFGRPITVCHNTLWL